MAAMPALACEGICPMAHSQTESLEAATPCPSHQSAQTEKADNTCDGLMLLSDCLDLTVAKADTATPQAIALS